ncbi:lipopolysaccharide assembly protein LapA domain-containing protein [Virgibacillus necropolis]|uniref:LapA family protein n=1 Tax=Virgibacillus necropolis TaxID=163877 RepID=UPI00384FA930
MKGQTYVIFAIIFVIIVAIFAVINVDPVEVNYLFGTGEAPLIFVILFSVLMGGIITAAVGIVKVFRLQREVKALRKENEQLKNSTNTIPENQESFSAEEKEVIEGTDKDK